MAGLGQGLCSKRIREWVKTENKVMEVGEDAPGVPEFIVIDGDESAGDGSTSDDDSGDENLIQEEGGGAGAGDEIVEL